MVESAPHPTNAHIQRITKEGRKLTYCLSVIQQPERARACGSGAKSSADRRPVDPPPVVELRIYEGEGGPENGAQDVTFSYDANFFLFATLEVARPIARGRVQTASTTQVPVLTGMPVSGMAYLDRPKEAGYFIFPDLSVRHEGKYCLSFNLYEETKQPKDADAEPVKEESKPKVSAGSGAPDSSFDWRLEVKSLPFTVYSAKKFPGLKESTVLSRTVAEQGCRVRIRRDVRMRRREDKGDNYDEHAEEEYARVGRSASQADHESYRQRSLSGSPIDPQRQPYPQERRSSGEYPPQPYQDYTPSPVTGHTAAQGGNLGFGPVNYGQQYQPPPPPPPSQYAQPPPPAQSQPMAPQQQYAPPPPAQYHQTPYHQGPQYHQQPPPPAGPYGYSERQPYQQPAPPPQQPHPQQTQPQHQPYPAPREYEPEYNRRPSAVYAAPPLAQGPQYPAVDGNYTRSGSVSSYRGYPPRPHSPTMPGHVNLAPLKMPSIEPKYQELASPAGPPSAVNRFAPPLPSPSYDRTQERPAQYGQYPAPLAAAEPPRNGKRSFDNVFGSSTTEQPLYNGMRPNVHEQNYDDDDEMSLEQLKMQYKRADGTSFSRELPVLE